MIDIPLVMMLGDKAGVRIKLADLICGQLIINDNYIGGYSPMLRNSIEVEWPWAVKWLGVDLM
eukprot:8846723-Ditylum_brightwellii.AAC.1